MSRSAWAARAHLAWLACRSVWLRVWYRLVSWVSSAVGLSTATSTTTTIQHHGPEAYRIYAFNEGGDPGFHREIPVRYFCPETWERDIQDLTGWDAIRVEIRYILRHKKYRLVLRPGDTCTFPPYPEPAAPALRLPRGVLSARLQGAPGSGIDTDITPRVLKYQGPKGDFHAGLGLKVRLFDMLPFDDHADNALRFTHLRLVDTNARITDFPYGGNPVMSLLSCKTVETQTTDVTDESADATNDHELTASRQAPHVPLLS